MVGEIEANTKLLTTAENVTIFGFKSGASNRIYAPLLPIWNHQIFNQHVMEMRKTWLRQFNDDF